jgi:hypothetical protein
MEESWLIVSATMRPRLHPKHRATRGESRRCFGDLPGDGGTRGDDG